MTAERRSQVGSGDAQRADPHLQLPPGPGHRPPHRPDPLSDSTPSWTADLDEIIDALTAAEQAEKLQTMSETSERNLVKQSENQRISTSPVFRDMKRRSKAAAQVIREGGLVAIPTETVYGLGADALNEKAVAAIYEAKGRPSDNPLIIHVPGAHWLERYCVNVPQAAYDLAEQFWPGPLTMILPRKDNVPDAHHRRAGHRGGALPRPSGDAWPSSKPPAYPSPPPAPTPPAVPAAPTRQDVLEDMDGKIRRYRGRRPLRSRAWSPPSWI